MFTTTGEAGAASTNSGRNMIMKELSVAIVDDNPMVLDKLDEILGQEEGLNVVGRAEDGEEAIHHDRSETPGCSAAGFDYAKN